MTITVLDIEQVRRMVAEPTQTTYTDVIISGYLTEFSEDKYAVAGEIWGEKASSLQATMYDFSADTASYKLSQVIDNAEKKAKYYNSKRKPTTSVWTKDPVEPNFDIVDNDTFWETGIVNDTTWED